MLYLRVRTEYSHCSTLLTLQKKKKDKKKKEKKKKKDSDEGVEEVAGEVAHLHIEDKLDEIAHKPHAKKSKFELQMEAALKKKEAEDKEHHEMDDKEAKKAEKAAEKARKEAEIARQIAEQEDAKAAEKGDGEEKEDGEVFYGAPDEKVWSDKSQAHVDAEAEAEKGPDLSVSRVLIVSPVSSVIIYLRFKSLPRTFYSSRTIRMERN